MKNLFPKSGIAVLVKTRKYHIDDNYVAIISEEEGSGWSVFKNQHYEVVKKFFEMTAIKIEDLDCDSRIVIEKLWKNNLISVNGKTLRQTLLSSNKKKFPNYLLVKVTSSCNLVCSYCYEHGSHSMGRIVNYDQVCTTIEFLLTKNSLIFVTFHGGEPLLQFELVKKIVEFTNKRLRQNCSEKKVVFSIQTNGFLLSKDVVTFAELNNIRIGISLDGSTERANMHRKSANGKISSLDLFLDAYKKYPTFIKSSCGLLAVLHRDNIEESGEFIEWLQDLGISSVYFNVLHMSNRVYEKNLLDKIPTIDETTNFYKKIIGEIKSRKIQKINVGNITYPLDAMLAFQPNHMCYNKGPCGAASEFLGIDVDGNYIICDCIPKNISIMRTVCLNNKILNDPGRGFIKETWCKFRDKNCHSCAFFGLCGGGCIGQAYLDTKCVEVDMLRCVVSKLIYKEFFMEFVSMKKTRPLFDYYYQLTNQQNYPSVPSNSR